MKYVITFHFRPEIANEHQMNDGSFTEVVDSDKFDEWLSENLIDGELSIVITLFEKVGNEDYYYNLKYGI